MYKWYNKDPRWTINKRADIIIVDSNIKKIYKAHVDVKETYCVFLEENTKDIKDFYSADDDWPPGWYWTFYPGHYKLWEMDKEENSA